VRLILVLCVGKAWKSISQIVTILWLFLKTVTRLKSAEKRVKAPEAYALCIFITSFWFITQNLVLIHITRPD
jgi:hypothetical protein